MSSIPPPMEPPQQASGTLERVNSGEKKSSGKKKAFSRSNSTKSHGSASLLKKSSSKNIVVDPALLPPPLATVDSVPPPLVGLDAALPPPLANAQDIVDMLPPPIANTQPAVDAALPPPIASAQTVVDAALPPPIAQDIPPPLPEALPPPSITIPPLPLANVPPPLPGDSVSLPNTPEGEPKRKANLRRHKSISSSSRKAERKNSTTELPIPESIPGLAKAHSTPIQKTDTPRQEKRRLIATEIYDTEVSYVNSLQTIFEHFVKPLKQEIANAKKPLFEKEALDEFSTLFSTWETLLNCHIAFRDQLNKIVSSWTDTSKIGEAILENTKFIKLYRHYVNSFDKLNATINQCQAKNKFFKKFVQDLEASPEFRNLTLQSFLIMPVQRIPRYVLLVTDLLKNTLPEHNDYSTLSESLELMKAFAEYINKSKADSENREKLESIKARVVDTGSLIDLDAFLKGRKLIKEGEVTVKDPKGKTTDSLIFLLTDNLLLTKPIKKNEYKLYDNIKLVASLSADDQKRELIIDVTAGKYHLKFSSSTPEKEYLDWKEKIQSQIKVAVQAMLKGEDHILDRDESLDDPTLGEDQKKKNALTRRKIAEELVQKEDEYSKRLQSLAAFVESLRKQDNKDLISITEVKTVFSNIEDISREHAELSAELTKRMAEWDSKPELGDIFSERLGMFQLYRPYILCHPQMLGTMNNLLLKKPLFVIAVNTWEKQGNNGQKIETTLELPLRRVDSIYAQLTDLLRNTPKDHPDYKNLVKVTKALKERDEELKKLSGLGVPGEEGGKRDSGRQRSWSVAKR